MLRRSMLVRYLIEELQHTVGLYIPCTVNMILTILINQREKRCLLPNKNHDLITAESVRTCERGDIYSQTSVSRLNEGTSCDVTQLRECSRAVVHDISRSRCGRARGRRERLALATTRNTKRSRSASRVAAGTRR